MFATSNLQLKFKLEKTNAYKYGGWQFFSHRNFKLFLKDKNVITGWASWPWVIKLTEMFAFETLEKLL